MHFAAYLQNELKLERGERVALMMPNLLQYPIALFWYLTCGFSCGKRESTLYPRELEHRLQDSGQQPLLLFKLRFNLGKIVFNTKVKHHVILSKNGRSAFFW